MKNHSLINFVIKIKDNLIQSHPLKSKLLSRQSFKFLVIIAILLIINNLIETFHCMQFRIKETNVNREEDSMTNLNREDSMMESNVNTEKEDSSEETNVNREKQSLVKSGNESGNSVNIEKMKKKKKKKKKSGEKEKQVLSCL